MYGYHGAALTNPRARRNKLSKRCAGRGTDFRPGSWSASKMRAAPGRCAEARVRKANNKNQYRMRNVDEQIQAYCVDAPLEAECRCEDAQAEMAAGALSPSQQQKVAQYCTSAATYESGSVYVAVPADEQVALLWDEMAISELTAEDIADGEGLDDDEEESKFPIIPVVAGGIALAVIIGVIALR